MAAGFEPHGAAYHARTFLGRDARSRVAHDERRTIRAGLEADNDLPARGRVLDRVVDKIGDRLRNQIPIAADRCGACGLVDGEIEVLVVGERTIELADAFDD